jgi:O-methyltransferase
MKPIWKDRLARLVPAINGKKIYLFGRGAGGSGALAVLQESGVRVIGFLDNFAEKDARFEGLPVSRPDTLAEEDADGLAVIVASQTYQEAMEDQLARLGLLKGVHYFCPLEPLRKVDVAAETAFLSRDTQKYNGEFTRIFLSRDRQRGVSLTLDEVYTLYQGVVATRPLDGCLAEVGVFRGGSARVICEAKGEAPLYLCDTFAGMPALENDKDTLGVWVNTHTTTSLESVQEYVGGYANVHFVKGIFPDSLAAHAELAMEQQRFKFVHLDVDLYESTLQSLAWFWPRMVSGGWLITHNYNLTYGKWGNTPGVEKAFREYLKEDACRIVEIAETQALIVKP